MRDTLRLFFFVALALSLLVLWTRWEKWQAAEQDAARSASQSQRAPDSVIPGDAANNNDSQLPVPSRTLVRENTGGNVPTFGDVAAGDAAITINAEWYVAEINENGGDIAALRLKKHKTQIEDGEGEDFPLVRSDNAEVFLPQSGMTDAKGGSGFPYHKTRFVWQNPGGDKFAGENGAATVILQAEGGGVILQKRYVFRQTSYLTEVQLAAQNTSTAALSPFAYFQLAHDGRQPASHSALLPTFFGAAVYTDRDKFVKVPFDDIGEDDYPRLSDDGWIGFIQRYFAVAWLPEPGKHEFRMDKSKNGGGKASVILPFGDIAPGESQTVSARLFAGAQEQDILSRLNEDGTAPGIHLAVDYGWLTFIADLLYKLLALIHDYVGNWGVAIILLTLAVKLLFYPLSSASYRSMAKMKAEAPRIKQLQERYANDKQKMQQEMMALYRSKKINPLGGCLPVLVQIPVFIALYWVLLGSVELRHAPFGLWLADLSSPDPYFILPVMMGVAMFLQTKLSPAPPDPTQAMIMRFLPIGFAAFSIFFPSGLVVYWLSNTLLSIAQQWHITRGINKKTAGIVN
ncbi:MAG: membrane protein insertase YidC [Gammaproteobacteria bacterium]